MPGQNEGADAHHPGVRREEPRARHRLPPPAVRPAGGTSGTGPAGTNGTTVGVGITNGVTNGTGVGTTQAVLDGRSDGALLCPTCARPLSDDAHRTTEDSPGTGPERPGPAAGDGDPLLSALRVSEARLRAAFWDAGIGMALIDPEDRIIEVNPAFATLTGRTVGELARTHIHEIFDPEGMPHRLFPALVHGERDRLRVEKQLKHREGRTVWSKVTVSLIRDASGGPLYTLALVEDITEQRRLGDRLEYQALHDPLTRLPNRTYFFERLDAACLTADRSTAPPPAPAPASPRPTAGDGDGDDGPRIGVCYLDLDGFAAINETLGHHIGDQLLIAVATRLRRGFTSHGSQLVARMGGDEFAVLVTDSRGSDQLTDLAARILEALERPFDVAGHRLVVTASVGVVERSVQETTPTDLVKDADATLYWSKADGRARWTLYDPDRGAHQLTRQLLATALRPALERGEFTIEYQPLVGLADGAVHGAEALVRWRHPRYGTLSPDRFIPLAEESGAIVPLGKWVLEESCRQARRWLTEFPETETFVSVNLAARQIWDSDVVADVAQALERTGLPARLLQLEITESALLGPGGRPLQALQALADMGVRIAIDDFGTGYSNLAYLSRLPVHVLKLDGTFIEGFRDPSPTGSRAEPSGFGARRSDADEQIVGAMVQLAHTLGLTVTAEGIESAAQAERLRLTGCDTAQGWYFARPGEAELVAAILRDNRDGRDRQDSGDSGDSGGGRDVRDGHEERAGRDGREARG
ncbi:EAL domain-containing protein [Kitasatospora purpeofusca]|uniref:putative bifunctional diguanylate cyclase/phosphodiesterase n=1 Tax=Kitasatospora purpeofusca TaxID=67352 RepID=UPI0033FD9440